MNFLDKLKKVMGEAVGEEGKVESLSITSSAQANFLAIEVTKAIDAGEEVGITLADAECGCPCLGIMMNNKPLRLMHFLEAREFADVLPKMSGMLVNDAADYGDDDGIMIHREKARSFAKVSLLSSTISAMLHTRVMVRGGFDETTMQAMVKTIDDVARFFNHVVAVENGSKAVGIATTVQRSANAAFAEYVAKGKMDDEAKVLHLKQSITMLSKSGDVGRSMMLAVVHEGGETIDLDEANERSVAKSEGIAFIGMNVQTGEAATLLVHKYGEDNREIIDQAEKLVVEAGDFDKFMNGPLTTMRVVSNGLKAKPTAKSIHELVKGALAGGQLRAITPDQVVEALDIKPAKLH